MARRLVGRALEMRIAEAAIAAFEQKNSFPRAREIGDRRFAVFLVDLSSDRHAQDRVCAASAAHFLAHAGAAVLRANMLLEAIVDQCVEIIDRLSPDIAAPSAIAAPGTAIFDEFLAAECNAAVSAGSALDIDLG